MKSVMIVDDAAFMRMSLRKIIEKDTEFLVVGEAVDGLDAVDKYLDLKPDIVTMDITMPNMEGTDALKEIIKINPEANIIMITALGQESHVRNAVISGAKGYILKPFNEEIVNKTLMKFK